MGCYIPNGHTFCRAPAISSLRFLIPFFSAHPSTSLGFHLGFQRLALSPVVMDAGGSGGGLFSVDPLERHAARGRGVITSMAAGNDVILLGTSKGWVIRYDFGVGDSQGQLASVVRLSEPFPAIFICSSSSQILTSLEVEAVISWCTVVLSRLKGLVVNAVAWNRQQITEGSTKEVLLGTENGQLFEMAVDEVDKKEKHVKLLFELTELPEAIMGLQIVFASYSDRAVHFMELPGEIPNRQAITCSL
ncbi:hypothetical protein BHM03_00013797 [Ensete ventricosum]|nr:hypothetical protein BHM03_00013797 [Ensete ventricosum]